MKPSSPSWPRGILAGALLVAGTPRVFPDANGRFALFQRPIQKRAAGEFFGGKLAVEAVLSQRFAILPRPGKVPPVPDRHALLPEEQPPEVARFTLLRLELENLSAENLEVEIVRVASALGKFNGEPAHVILAPHQTAGIDSLVAEQKITSGGIPLAIELRHATGVETQRLVLNNLVLARN